MSRYYEYVNQPVSVSGYNGGGTRTYVTRVEERIQEVCRPAVAGYTYSTATRVVPAKESRPPEVEGFIAQIPNEVNGPSSSTTMPSPRRPWDFHDSPAKVDQVRDYGGSKGDYSIKADSVKEQQYGIANNRQDNSTMNPYWGKLSNRNYVKQPPNDNSPRGNAPIKQPMPYKTYGDPEIPQTKHTKPIYDQPPLNSKYDEVPYNQQSNYSLKPLSPKGYGTPDNHWDIANNSEKQPPTGRGHSKGPHNQWGNSQLKPQSYGAYGGGPDIQQNRPTYPTFDQSSPNYGNGEWNNSSMNPASPPPKVHGNLATHNRGTPYNTIHDWQSSNNNNDSDPNNPWDNSPKEPQSSYNKGYGAPGTSSTKWDRSSSPPINDGKGYVPNIQRGNTSLKPLIFEAYKDPTDPQSRSSKPMHDQLPSDPPYLYDNQPPIDKGNIPNNQWGNHSPDLKTPSPKDHASLNHREGKPKNHHVVIDTPQPPYVNVGGIYHHEPKTSGDNSQVKPAGYSYDQNKDFQAKDYGSNNQMRPSSNLPSHGTPRPQHAYGRVMSDDIENATRKSVFVAETSPKGVAVEYSLPPTFVGVKLRNSPPPLVLAKKDTVDVPLVIDSKEAQRLYGAVNVPPRKNIDKDDKNGVITSQAAAERYNGFFI